MAGRCLTELPVFIIHRLRCVDIDDRGRRAVHRVRVGHHNAIRPERLPRLMTFVREMLKQHPHERCGSADCHCLGENKPEPFKHKENPCGTERS